MYLVVFWLWSGANPLRASYDRDVSLHPNEALDHREFCGAPDATLPPFSMFQYMDQYPVFSDVACFHDMQTGNNELKVQDRLGKRRETTVRGWSKIWNL